MRILHESILTDPFEWYICLQNFAQLKGEVIIRELKFIWFHFDIGKLWLMHISARQRKARRHEVENWKIWGINDTAMMKHSCCKKWDTMAFLTFLESYHVKSWRFPWISFTMSGSLVTSMQAPKWKWPTLPFERVGNLNLVEVGGSCWWVKMSWNQRRLMSKMNWSRWWFHIFSDGLVQPPTGRDCL